MTFCTRAINLLLRRLPTKHHEKAWTTFEETLNKRCLVGQIIEVAASLWLCLSAKEIDDSKDYFKEETRSGIETTRTVEICLVAGQMLLLLLCCKIP